MANDQPVAVTRLARPRSSPRAPARVTHCVRRDTAAIRSLLVEDLGLLRDALTALLAASPDIEVVGSHPCGERALSTTLRLRPDLVVVDVDLAGGVELVRRLRARAPGCRVLALATAARPGAIRAALDAQVLGVLDKDASSERLRHAVRCVAAGARFIDENLAVAALCVGASPLTQRELAVLRHAAEGASVADIAEALSLSCGTVRNYLSRAVAKTGARSRIDAIRIASEAAWL